MSRQHSTTSAKVNPVRDLIVLIDLDGVLVDFVGAALQAHGLTAPDEWPDVEDDVYRRKKNIEKTFGIGKDEFWSPIHAQGEEFWANLPLLHDGMELYHRLAENRRVKICTTPSEHPSSSSGKVRWMQQQFGSKFRDYVIAPMKWELAHSRAVLIDDFEDNILKFREHGGHAWLFPRPWNSRGVVVNLHSLDTYTALAGLDK